VVVGLVECFFFCSVRFDQRILFCGRWFARMFFSFVRFDSVRGFYFAVVGLVKCFFFCSVWSEDSILWSSVWSNVFSFGRFGEYFFFSFWLNWPSLFLLVRARANVFCFRVGSVKSFFFLF